MLRKILNFRVLYRATPLFSFAIHTKYPKINHSPLRGSICSEIKSILHMKKGGQYLPECQLCDIQKLMIFVSKWGGSLVRNIQTFLYDNFVSKIQPFLTHLIQSNLCYIFLHNYSQFGFVRFCNNKSVVDVFY